MANLHPFAADRLDGPAQRITPFLTDLLTGLASRPRRISPKYFYDEAGSALFERICALPEYYPTRTERAILQRFGHEMAERLGPGAELVEFGAGSLAKVRLLLDAFAPADLPRAFVPIDISGAHLEASVERLRADYPGLAVHALAADYTAPLTLPHTGAGTARRVGFFPGSTLGNFAPDEALAFLKQTAELLRGGGLLVGIDLTKEPALLHDAYNDRAGITAAFNLNLLQRANRELGADFDLTGFAHYAPYDPVMQRIEMHLISRHDQTVHIGAHAVFFAEGESLLTEYSHKYTVERFHTLARRAGYTPDKVWTDDGRLFSVHWLKAPAN